jgi:DNA gyrase subunit A
MDVGTVKRVDIDQTMRSAYLSYAMSVITARALPDVRDGLKPVQRRILYAMHDMGIDHIGPTRKSARIIGEVLGKYHPHGNDAVYEAMVRMAQDFSMRYMLVEGQGNFGSVDGDGAAAMRYTEARLSAIGDEMLLDIDKDAVDFADNFDSSLQEPTVLPARLPNLLLNGVGGIAVGMATNIPPHNLGELADAIAFLIKRHDAIEDVTLDDLMRFIKGPDFPTGGTILGLDGVRQAYATGNGRVLVRAQAHIENMRGGHSAIIITELPYQVNKANLVERIASLVRDERLVGVGDLRDESDRTGMRVVIELKRSTEPGPLMNALLKHTQFQTTFGVNMLALVAGEPRRLSLKQVLSQFIDHRHDVIERRTRFDLAKALARAHILEGLLKALDHLDEVISIIRRSRTADTAKNNLIKAFQFSEVQAQAILDMQLRRLAALERHKIEDEYQEVTARIAYLKDLLSSKAKILGLIAEDMAELKKAYGDARRTVIAEVDDTSVCDPADLVPNEGLYLLFTRGGSVRRWPAAVAAEAKGVPGMAANEKDTVAGALMVQAQDTIALVTNQGRAFGILAHQLPDGEQQDQGLPFTQLPHLQEGERVVAALALDTQNADAQICLGTRQGKVKRLAAAELDGLGRAPVEVIGLSDGDALGWAFPSTGADLLMVTARGKAMRFSEDSVRPQGKSAGGMRGISLKDDDDAVIAMAQVVEDGQLLVASAIGYAKRSPLTDYAAQGRGGQGAYTIDPAKESGTGPLVNACVVLEGDNVVFGTASGRNYCVAVSDVAKLERASWGRLVTRTRRNVVVSVEDDQVISVVRLVRHEPDSAAHPPPEAKPAPARPARSSRATKTRPAAEQETEQKAPGKTKKPAPKASRARAKAPASKATAKRREPAEAADEGAAPAFPASTDTPSQPRRGTRAKASQPQADATPEEAKAPEQAAKPRKTRAVRPKIEQATAVHEDEKGVASATASGTGAAPQPTAQKPASEPTASPRRSRRTATKTTRPTRKPSE